MLQLYLPYKTLNVVAYGNRGMFVFVFECVLCLDLLYTLCSVLYVVLYWCCVVYCVV